MRRDPLVWAIGEDLGRGLANIWGFWMSLVQREYLMHLFLNQLLWGKLGAAMAGTRPVVEMRFADFALCAVDELINQAAKARYMLGGQVKVPMVIRELTGMWRSSAAQHSQSLSWYTHIPGLVVAVPSTLQIIGAF